MLFTRAVSCVAQLDGSVNCSLCIDQVLPRSALLSPVASRIRI